MSKRQDDRFTGPSGDDRLAAAAMEGDRAALSDLVREHQDWLFNIALGMTGSPEDAEDVTQEIFIRMITRLSTFRGKSSFRTWLYRIAANYVITMKKKRREYVFSSFEKHGALVDGAIPDLDPPDSRSYPVDMSLIEEETKRSCLMGMLLCLDRKERLVFILGAVFGISSETGGIIVKISSENFRKRLSRSRKKLSAYMDEKCGLMNSANPCRCIRKIRGAVDAGYIDPGSLQFNRDHVARAMAVADEYTGLIGDVSDLRADRIFREQPLLVSPDFISAVEMLIGREPFRKILNFH